MVHTEVHACEGWRFVLRLLSAESRDYLASIDFINILPCFPYVLRDSGAFSLIQSFRVAAERRTPGASRPEQPGRHLHGGDFVEQHEVFKCDILRCTGVHCDLGK